MFYKGLSEKFTFAFFFFNARKKFPKIVLFGEKKAKSFHKYCSTAI